MNLVGRELRRLPLDLEHVRDIEEHEGPLLSEFRSRRGESYLYYWCDCNETHNRWLVFRTTRRDIISYEGKQMSLRRLIEDCADGMLYVCDTSSDGCIVQTTLAFVSELPEGYLPTQDSYFEAVSAHNGQSVLINGAWGHELMSAFPRKFLQAYSFLVFFGGAGVPEKLRELKLNFKGGYVFHTFYERLRASHSHARADLVEVAYASPGYMQFSVVQAVAADLRKSIVAHMAGGPELRTELRALQEWSNNDKDAMSDGAAAAAIERVGQQLHIRTDDLVKLTGGYKQAAKTLGSFARRLAFLADLHDRGTALIIGVPIHEYEEVSVVELGAG